MADPHGDPSYRIIPVGTPRSRLTITHNYYDHSDAEVVTRLPVVAPWLMRVKFP
jgi:L-ascorbate metabolism protein UlaG (beta-lactamase superfamily)